MSLTKEQLLAPRYKVIADYPQPLPLHNKGDIMTLVGIHYTNRERGILDTEIVKYPAIFHRLLWWENRTAEEMPEYLKFMGQVVKPEYYPDAPYLFDIGHEQCMVDYWEIATLEEYLSYQASLKP